MAGNVCKRSPATVRRYLQQLAEQRARRTEQRTLRRVAAEPHLDVCHHAVEGKVGSSAFPGAGCEAQRRQSCCNTFEARHTVRRNPGERSGFAITARRVWKDRRQDAGPGTTVTHFHHVEATIRGKRNTSRVIQPGCEGVHRLRCGSRRNQQTRRDPTNLNQCLCLYHRSLHGEWHADQTHYAPTVRLS